MTSSEARVFKKSELLFHCSQEQAEKFQSASVTFEGWAQFSKHSFIKVKKKVKAVKCSGAPSIIDYCFLQ